MDQLLVTLLPALPGVLLLAVLLPVAVHRRRLVLADHGAPAVERLGLRPEAPAGDPEVEDLAGPELAAAEAPGRHALADSDDLAAHRRRVEVTVQVMARRTSPDEASVLVEARLQAALDRLEGPVRFERPALGPVDAHRLLAAVASGPAVASPAPAPATATEAGAGAGAEREPVLVAAVAAAPDVPEVVLPVPPMAPSTPSRRRRPRLRG